MRALAVLGLGIARDRGAVAEVATIARSVDAGNVARAAAAYALGDLDAQGEVPTLLEIAEDGDPLPRRMALVALARMAESGAKVPSWQHEAVQAMADAVFAGAEDAQGGLSSMQALATAGVARRAHGRGGGGDARSVCGADTTGGARGIANVGRPSASGPRGPGQRPG